MPKRLAPPAPRMKMQEVHPSANTRAVLCFDTSNSITVTAEVDLQTKRMYTMAEENKSQYFLMTCCGGEYRYCILSFLGILIKAKSLVKLHRPKPRHPRWTTWMDRDIPFTHLGSSLPATGQAEDEITGMIRLARIDLNRPGSAL